MTRILLPALLLGAFAAPLGADETDPSLPPPEIRGGTGASTTSSPTTEAVVDTRPGLLHPTPRIAPPVRTTTATTTTVPMTTVRTLPPPPPPPSPSPPAGTVRYYPELAFGSSIQEIRKNHNLPTRDGQLALRMDVLFNARGQAGRDVYLAAWFTDRRTGKLVSTPRRFYADGMGHLTVQTHRVRVAGDPASYASSLWVPYSAFPPPATGASYEVDAKVQLLRQESNGRVTVLCEGTTTFTVHGPGAPGAVAPASAPPGGGGGFPPAE
jgi:hypothetical protein